MFEEYSTLPCANAIGKSSDLYVARDWRWPRPIYFALTDDQVTYAAVWEERCVTRLFPGVSSPNHRALQLDLHVLSEMRQRRAPAVDFVERARAIWYRGLSRDAAQTAIARLFELVAHELHPDGRRPPSLYGAAINTLASASEYPLSMLEIVVAEFSFVVDQRQQGMRPSQILGLSDVNEYSFLNRTPNS